MLSVVVLSCAVWPVVECHSINRKRWLADGLVAASLGETICTMHILPSKIFRRVERSLIDL